MFINYMGNVVKCLKCKNAIDTGKYRTCDNCREYMRAYHRKHQEQLNQQRKLRHEANKETDKIKWKEYYETNKDNLSAKKKEYRNQNKDKLQEYHKEYNQKNIIVHYAAMMSNFIRKHNTNNP